MKQTDFRDVPDELWERIEPLLAPFKRKRSGGSKPLAQRTVLAGILYKCRTGCQWAMLPACYGSKSSVHEHFQRWNKAGIMAEIFRILLAEYGEKVGVDAQWQAMDGTLLQAPTQPSLRTPREICETIRQAHHESPFALSGEFTAFLKIKKYAGHTLRAIKDNSTSSRFKLHGNMA